MRSTVLGFLVLFANAALAQESATPWIGVGIERGTAGVLVNKVMPDTPAARARLQAGDLILRLDGQVVSEPLQVITYLQKRGVGEKVTLRFIRAGRVSTVSLALEARPAELALLRQHLLGKKPPRAIPAEGLLGSVVVAEFWATWCGPCNSTLPRLSGWQDKLGARGLRVVGISTEPPEVVARHVAGKQLSHTMVSDAEAYDAWRVPAVPTLVVIDRQGIVRAVEVGAGDRLDAIEAAFLPLLDAP